MAHTVRLLEFNPIPGAPWLTAQLAGWEMAAQRGEADDILQPPYPAGVVSGPCVCGSWPGGECLHCEWRPAREVDSTTQYTDLMRLVQSEDRLGFVDPWGER